MPGSAPLADEKDASDLAHYLSRLFCHENITAVLELINWTPVLFSILPLAYTSPTVQATVFVHILG